MRDFIRFLFPAQSRDAMNAGSIDVSDIDYHHMPTAGLPYPQSMKLTFTTTDPLHDPPELYPLFPGEMLFMVDSSAPGTLPNPETINLTPAGYAAWQTQGTLVIIAQSSDVVQGLRAQLSGLEVVPTVLWYKGVTLTADFLLTTLVNGLKREKVSRGGNAAAVNTGDADWPNHAVCGFLRGTYRPRLRLAANAAQDDVVQFPMPVVTKLSNGSYELVVTAAQPVSRPQDGPSDALAQATPGAKETDASHAKYAVLPARLLYRSARAHMIDAQAGNAVADKILADWPVAPRYFAIRCTRTWQVQDNVSIHFPRQVIRVRETPGGTELARQRMPAHGIIYLKQLPTNPAPAPPSVTIEFEGDMKWLDGGQADVWRVAAATVPVMYDLAVLPNPHVQLRLPMSQAMFAEPVDRPGGARCTYMSMRRSIRALVDNRITGGRLNHDRAHTSATTRQLIDVAWKDVAATSNLVQNNQPLPNLQPGQARPWLQPIFEAFFPNDAPAHAVSGTSNRTQVFTLGHVAYELWQTNYAVLQNPGTRSNFSDGHVGRGGPATLVATGLARGSPADFHVDLDRNPGESGDDYANRIVDAMITGLQPGAILQFWHDYRDFEDLKGRRYSPATSRGIGHSLVFQAYLPGGTGIRVIDQFGLQDCNIEGTTGARKIAWGGYGREVWVAANWGD